MRKKFLHDERGDGDEICGGIIAVVIILAIIYYIIMFILSILTQILIIAIITFVVYRVHSKQNEITKWIQPSIVSLTEPEISRLVLSNLFCVAPIYNRYNVEYRKYNEFENKLQNLRKEIKQTSDTIEDYQKKIKICKNRGEPISPATKTEIGILHDKISNETDNKYRLESQYSDLENLMKKKGDELDKLKKEAHGFIIGRKEGYKKKYEEEEEAWERGEREAAKAAARKEKEKNEIRELVIEINGLIENAKSIAKKKCSDPSVLSAFINLQKQLSDLSYCFKIGKISFSNLKRKILDIKSDAEILEEFIKIGATNNEETKNYREETDGEKAYRILGVHPNATDDQIKKVYRALLLVWHPDITGGDDARVKEITWAYAHLKGERKFV